MSSIGGLGRFFNTARTAWCRLVETQTKIFLKNHKSQMNSKKKNWGRSIRQCIRLFQKSDPNPQCNAMLDIPFALKNMQLAQFQELF
jgi:hypothetical protein